MVKFSKISADIYDNLYLQMTTKTTPEHVKNVEGPQFATPYLLITRHASTSLLQAGII